MIVGHMIDTNEIKCNKKWDTVSESIKLFMNKQGIVDDNVKKEQIQLSEESFDNNGNSNEKICHNFDIVKTDPIITFINSRFFNI